jgi:hypothetical protein
MLFSESTPERKKKALKLAGGAHSRQLINSPIPPAGEYYFLSQNDVMHGGDRTLMFDAESYINYFCISFKCVETGGIICFEQRRGFRINNELLTQGLWCTYLSYVLHRFRLIGFNSRTYDVPITFVAIQGVHAPMLKQISDEIIKQDMQAYEVERKYCAKIPVINHIDLIEVAPLQASLKLYAGRIHCERLQDLPYPEDLELTEEQMLVVRDYNICSDLVNTQLLWKELEPQIKLRETLGAEYNCDLRSKSDAQLAETVINSELTKLGVFSKSPTIEPGWEFGYTPPEFITFKTPQFQNALEVVRNATFIVGNGGSADCPPEIEKLRLRLSSCIYRMGIGGLHSSEESQAYKADDDTLLIDRDVARYYPSIILNQELYPQHLGRAFLEVYRGIVTKRDMAKTIKDKTTDQSLKIVINGSFGKLGNLYSKLYSPDLLLQVTMTGQLCLLMLIEAIELAGISVISTNTDGVVMRCPKDKYQLLETVVMVWENTTGFVTEETRYKGLYSRDVNNYIAVKEEGGCKTKGIYSNVGSALNSPLSKNPESHIISMAVQAYLEHGTPLADTIDSCRDIKHFVNLRTVKGGAEKNGVYLGKAIRWYYAKGETGCINYVLTGNKVPKSDGAKPLMILPNELPEDLDFDYYVNEAEKALYEIGYYQRAKTGSLI